MALEPPGPRESSSGGGMGPGHVPRCCCCCSGDHNPENCGHGSRHHREWEERETTRSQGPQSGLTGQRCPESQVSPSVPRDPHRGAGGVSPRSRAQSAEVQGGSSRGDPGLSRRLGASRTQGPIRQEMPTNICCFQREIPHVAPLGARLTDCLLLCGFKCPLVLRALPAAAPPGPSAPQSPGFLTSLDSAPTFGIFHAYTVSGPGCL